MAFTWKVFILTPEESRQEICFGFGYAMLHQDRWQTSNYGTFSAETHYDTAIEHFVYTVDGEHVVCDVKNVYILDDEDSGLIVLRHCGFKKDDPKWVEENIRFYNIDPPKEDKPETP